MAAMTIFLMATTSGFGKLTIGIFFAYYEKHGPFILSAIGVDSVTDGLGPDQVAAG